ncbi:MAG: hypothetical protein A3G18_10305 [Rhodospirillales bacterium RIFCSPLOWO2_12_FULL_58_28]|nr:MAG: hypothetical protein A3H92_08480 [Rhodospirillales bacterium RIFCSPLOWO2_02_FULL_58_16]OHC77670.1 MAG: hypothetical protein A3G18_10305 [Rhodospirillales bacterium RIFCSPLOWO2_12_FULL_58_28]
MVEHVIVLEIEDESKILSGKTTGVRARLKYDLDKLELTPDHITIKFKVPTVTSSFVLGMLGESVKKLGLEGFKKKYGFDAQNRVLETIADNIDFAAADGTALPPSAKS